MNGENKKTWKGPAVTTPLIVAFTVLTLNFSGYAIQKSLENGQNNYFLIITVIQLAALAFPCVFYYLIKGRRLASPMFITPLKPYHIVFLIFTLLLFISGTILLKYMYYIGGLNVGTMNEFYENISQQDSINHLGVIISMIVIPAVFEELFFRGLVLSEYRSMGSVNAVLMSALCFAALHFSFTEFPIYFFSGIILGFVTVITRSLFAPIVLHLASNTINIYSSDLFIRVMVQKSGKFFVGFIIVMVFGLALLLVISRLEHVYIKYSQKPPINAIPPRSKDYVTQVFLSPTFLVLIAVFILISAFM